MIKYEKSAHIQEIYKDKMKVTLSRAEYIKKTALNKPDYQTAPTDEPQGNNDGGTGTAPAKKKEKKEGDDDENKKM